MSEAFLEASPVIKIIGGDDASLGRCVGIVEPCVGQEAAELLNVAMCHGGRPCLDEVYLVGILRKLLAAKRE